MAVVLKQTVTVGPEGKIEIPRSHFTPGTTVEVTVIAIASATTSRNLDQLDALRQLQESMNLTREQADKWVAENNRQFRGKAD